MGEHSYNACSGSTIVHDHSYSTQLDPKSREINELKKGEHIVEFVSGGPKNYAYKTNRRNEMCKVRGFTLHVTNSQLINFESVKRMVLDPLETTITVTNPQKICRDKRKRKLYNREEQKNYQMLIK